MSPTDPLLRYVGLPAYEKAGGTVRYDLFSKDHDEGLAEDAALVRKLAAAKLDAEAEKVREAEGWAFVIHELQDDADAYGYRREQPARREATKDEQQRRAEVEQELTAMEDEGWDEATPEGRAAAERWDRLEAELEDLDARREEWTPEQRRRCGVYLGIGDAGQVVQRRGLVDPAWDRKQREEAEAKQREQEKAAGTPGTKAEPAIGDAAADAGEKPENVEMPRTLVWKLTKARTEALRAGMIQNPAASADLLVAHLCQRLLYPMAAADALPLEVSINSGHDFSPGTGKSDPARGSGGTHQPSEAQTVFYEALQAWRVAAAADAGRPARVRRRPVARRKDEPAVAAVGGEPRHGQRGGTRPVRLQERREREPRGPPRRLRRDEVVEADRRRRASAPATVAGPAAP